MGVVSEAEDVRGFVEARGPDRISGWAFRPAAPPVTLVFSLDGEVLGDCLAAAARPDLDAEGMGVAHVGFSWPIPDRAIPIDPAAIEVKEASSGLILPNVRGLRVRRRSAMRGQVQVRGPLAIAGSAWSPTGPVRLAMMLGRKKLGECVAELARPDAPAPAQGQPGFSWQLPSDASVDPAKIRVVEASTGAELPDAPGLVAQSPPPVWGFVDVRGPAEIGGWTWSSTGPVHLAFMLGAKKLGQCVADLPRPELAAAGFGDGRAGFSWRMPPARDIDPAAIRVVQSSTGAELPDVPGLIVSRPPRVWGFVELRGPEAISGWAWARDGVERLRFLQDGKVIGEAPAALPRKGLKELGFGDGRVGFEWRLPFTDPAINPADIEVRADPRGVALPDAPGVEPRTPALVRGLVEARGPHGVSGWAKGPHGPVRLEILLDGERLGECSADLYRAGLEEAGLGDGRLGFDWSFPASDQPIDPAALVVREPESGVVIPDAEGLRPIAPPQVRGAVDARGPEFIAGWARGPEGPVTLALRRAGKEIGRVQADLPRDFLAGKPGFGDGRVGFAWRLPFTDPPLDPAEVEVSEVSTGEILIDAQGLRAERPPVVRGVVEERGPAFVSGWAKGPDGPIRLEFVLDGERLGECVADHPRRDLAETGLGDGRAGFRWWPPFREPPIDVARLLVRDARSGAVIHDAPGVRPISPGDVRGRVEVRGPDAIAGWACAAEGPVMLRFMRGEELLDEVAADQLREGLLKDAVGDGRVGFTWPLPITQPPVDPGSIRVVEAARGVEISDAPGLRAVPPPAVRGVVEECSYRLVAGWAWDGRPEERLEVEIVQDGQVIGRCLTDRRRGDLVRSGLDDGRHGFSWVPPRKLKGFDAAKVQVHCAGQALPLAPHRARDTGLTVSQPRAEAGWLLARLSRNGARESVKALDIVCDGAFLLRADIADLAWNADGHAELEVELPRSLYDGRPHRLTLHEAREGLLIGGQSEPLMLCSAFNSMVELLTPLEIRGWVIDPEDPDGKGQVELREGDRLIRTVGFGRERPEVAKAVGAAHAWEFAIRRLPLDLFDGETHELSLTVAGRPIFPHRRRRLQVCWTQDEAAQGSERFEGAVQEITPLALKGYVLDHLTDGPVALEVLVDGVVIAELMADRYVAALKDHAGHGFHGFDYVLPAGLMNGRRRAIEVRPKGSRYALPPGRKSLTFPLCATGEAPPPLAPPSLHSRLAARAEPALLSLIVLNLNGDHVLEPFLRSIEQTRFRDELEVIVIDHGSTDDSRRIIEDYRARLRLIAVYRGENHSFSASCNLGAVLAKGEHLVFVNNDIVFTEDCLAPLRDVLDGETQVGLAGLRLLEPRYRGEGRWERATHHTGVRFQAMISQDKVQPWLYHPVEVEDGGEAGTVVEPAATAALAMMRKADFRAVGGFDETYHYGYEDVDLALRVRGRLGKLAVCRLDATAVHNRSATREAKLVKAASGASAPVGRRAAHANLDIFTRRFSRHLPRLILRQLAERAEAWRAAPLRISFVVGDMEAGRDAKAARALGAELRARYGCEPMLVAEDTRDLAQTDVLVSLRPGYELRRLVHAAPGLVTCAGRLNGGEAWDGRSELYQLALDLAGDPQSAAEHLRGALLDLLSGPRRRIAVKAQAENEPHALALARAFEGMGHIVRLDGPRHWLDGLAASDELVVAMAGVRTYAPFVGAVNALCVAPGAVRPDAEALDGFDHVFEAADPGADAAALLAMHEGLRREFLGGLAD